MVPTWAGKRGPSNVKVEKLDVRIVSEEPEEENEMNPITLEDVQDAWEFYLTENLEEDWFQEGFVERLKMTYPELDHEDLVAAVIEHTAKLKVEVKLMDDPNNLIDRRAAVRATKAKYGGE